MELLDELPCGVLVTDASGRIHHANAEMLALTGRTLAACRAAPMETLFPPAGRIFLQTHVWPSVLRDGRVAEIQLPLLGAQGDRIPVLLNCRQGQFNGSAAYFWTLFPARQREQFEAALLAARRSAEESLQRQAQSERFTRSVTDAIPGLVAFWDRDLRCRFANKGYLDVFELVPGTLLGSHAREALGDDLYTFSEPYILKALAGQEQSFERAVAKPDGECSQTLVKYVPQVQNGQVIGFLSMVSDITSLKQVEAALRVEMAEREYAHQEFRRSSAALEEAQRLGRIGSWSWQIEEDVVTWSTELFNILGCDPSKGTPNFAEQASLYRPACFGRLREQVARALNTGEPYALELAYVRPDGAEGWVEARGECVRDALGQTIGLQGTVQDITSRHLIEQRLAAQSSELQRSNADLERFAYVASHDLQEPLRMVCSYGQLLQRRFLADLQPEAQEFVAYMVDGGQRAQALIRDLLALARLDSQAQPWAPVDLQALLVDTLRPMRLLIQDSGAQVTSDPLPTVVGDARQLGQLLANLLGNAIKFRAEAAPRVHIAAEREASGWRISVKDNGIGIESRYFERVFQMFQRLHLREVYEGTGIGLAICKRVVERHGGQIGVSSVRGKGTTFFFFLPDAAAPRAHHALAP
jgi:PAS domain S-box-containing protein